jgi:hypothetical protein
VCQVGVGRLIDAFYRILRKKSANFALAFKTAKMQNVYSRHLHGTLIELTSNFKCTIDIQIVLLLQIQYWPVGVIQLIWILQNICSVQLRSQSEPE